MVEHLLAKEKVVGSTPISRSTTLTTECEKVFRRWEALPEELPDSPAGCSSEQRPGHPAKQQAGAPSA